MFRAIDKNGRIAAAIGDDGALMRRAGRGDGIRMTPGAADLPHADRYFAYDLRIGGATDAADASATMPGICQHGLWSEKSPVVMQYIRHRDKWKNNPMLRVGI